MPENLTKQLSGKLTAAQILKIYGSIKIARDQPQDIRDGVIRAYNDTVYLLYLPALILCQSTLTTSSSVLILMVVPAIIPLIAAFTTTNFFLGDNHNAVENKKVVVAETDLEDEPRIASGSGSRSPELEAQNSADDKKGYVHEQ